MSSAIAALQTSTGLSLDGAGRGFRFVHELLQRRDHLRVLLVVVRLREKVAVVKERLLAPVVQLRDELQVLRRRVEHDVLPALRDENQQRHRERVPALRAPLQRVSQPRDALGSHLGRHRAVEIDRLGLERLAAGHGGDLRVGHVLERFVPRHARDELLQDEQIEALVVLERVHEVLQQRGELDVAVLLREVPAERRERAEPQRHVLAVVLQLLSPLRELLDDDERQHVVPHRREVLERVAHGRDHVRVRLDLTHDRVHHRERVRVRHLPELPAEFLHVVFGQTTHHLEGIALRHRLGRRERGLHLRARLRVRRKHRLPLRVQPKPRRDRERRQRRPHLVHRAGVRSRQPERGEDARAHRVFASPRRRVVAALPRPRDVLLQAPRDSREQNHVVVDVRAEERDNLERGVRKREALRGRRLSSVDVAAALERGGASRGSRARVRLLQRVPRGDAQRVAHLRVLRGV
eukprot:30948-Pelagococcus_subviridis.AAC.10